MTVICLLATVLVCGRKRMVTLTRSTRACRSRRMAARNRRQAQPHPVP